MLFFAVGTFSIQISAQALKPPLNPAKLGSFCPDGTTLVDEKNTKEVSLKEQRQIDQKVRGFMALDTLALRSVGHPEGPQRFWKKGYTAEFEAKEIGAASQTIQYLAFYQVNKCADKSVVVAIVALDTVAINDRNAQSKTTSSTSTPFLSDAWDGFSKIKITQINDRVQLAQPITFVAIPLRKSTKNNWFVEQERIPLLIRYSILEERHEISKLNSWWKCDSKSPSNLGGCELRRIRQIKLEKNTRAPWTIYPGKR